MWKSSEHDGEDGDIVVETSRLIRKLEKDLSLMAGELRPWRSKIVEQAMAVGLSLGIEMALEEV